MIPFAMTAFTKKISGGSEVEGTGNLSRGPITVKPALPTAFITLCEFVSANA